MATSPVSLKEEQCADLLQLLVAQAASQGDSRKEGRAQNESSNELSFLYYLSAVASTGCNQAAITGAPERLITTHTGQQHQPCNVAYAELMHLETVT